jgi:hypothetical protein
LLSFSNALSAYEFKRINEATRTGVEREYSHPCFVKGRLDLLGSIKLKPRTSPAKKSRRKTSSSDGEFNEVDGESDADDEISLEEIEKKIFEEVKAQSPLAKKNQSFDFFSESPKTGKMV